MLIYEKKKDEITENFFSILVQFKSFNKKYFTNFPIKLSGTYMKFHFKRNFVMNYLQNDNDLSLHLQ